MPPSHSPAARQSRVRRGRAPAAAYRMTLCALLLACAASRGAESTVTYHATIDNVKYLYATVPPVARLKPGDILDTNTLDAAGGALRKPGDTIDKIKGDNPLTGPFYVEGAMPGDTLAVKILSVDVDGDQGWGGLFPDFGALNKTTYTAMLHEPLPVRIWYYPIDRASHTATFHAQDSDFTVQIPVSPFLGCIGVAPADGEARAALVPAEFGGNMDIPEAAAGNTLYFPVNVPGGLLYLGDGHAAMGDGEVDGTAIEAPLRVRLQLSLIKGHQTHWPRIENEHAIMAVGVTRPVDDALRVAFTELVAWIHRDYGLSDLDAYELLSKVARIRLAEMVDPNYVVVASIDKKYLPRPLKSP